MVGNPTAFCFQGSGVAIFTTMLAAPLLHLRLATRFIRCQIAQVGERGLQFKPDDRPFGVDHHLTDDVPQNGALPLLTLLHIPRPNLRNHIESSIKICDIFPIFLLNRF
ncbi:MAG: hypothetical protein ACOCYT_05130 [Chloroflexota bacterium]